MGTLVFLSTAGGQVNLVGPNTGTTYNINVPATNGNMIVDNGSGTLTVQSLIATGNSAFTSTGALQISAGTTAQRPTPVSGMMRFNATTNKFEGYNASAWGALGGGATGGGADQIFVENGQTVTADYTISTNFNAMSTGPITVNTGITVTIPTDSVWVVL
jgi:hypothetical protein